MRVAVFPSSLDPLFISGLPDNLEFLYLVAGESAEEEWAGEFLLEEKIVSYALDRKHGKPADFSTGNILEYSNIDKLVETCNIDALLITHRGSDQIESWATRTGVKIISTPYSVQLQFENKIWFNDFLLLNNIPCPEGAVLHTDRKANFYRDRMVLQEPLSFGSMGTHFVSAGQLDDFLVAHNTGSGREFLAREFIDGEVYGISVFIDDSVIALSALRQQCFWPGTAPEARQKLFAGIAWIAAADISENLRKSIDSVFGRLGELLYRQGFRGFANFDFIAAQSESVQVIECNPRLSSATPQLFHFHELLSGVNPGPGFLLSLLNTERSEIEPEVFLFPDSKFKGGLIDIPAQGTGDVSTVFKPGLYNIKDGSIEFITPDIRRLSNANQQFVLYSDAVKGDKYQRDETIAAVLSNFPLFNADGSPGETAFRIVEHFRYE